MSTVVATAVPRFALLATVGGSRALLGRPVALPGAATGAQLISEASPSAEAFGIQAGMRLSEALARCPELELVTPDPEHVDRLWEGVVAGLESIGAAVEADEPGRAFFEADGLRGLYGGHLEGVLTEVRKTLEIPIRIGAAPSRFCAHVAATRTQSRKRTTVVAAPLARSFLAPLSIDLLQLRPELSGLVGELQRLGIASLGEFAKLTRRAIADRFGNPGLYAQQLALGGDTPLRPRSLRSSIVEAIELPEAASGEQLERMLGLLIDRLLASPERRERTLRKLTLSARLAERGGSWRATVTLREASADATRLRILLTPKLFELPAPAERLGLEAECFGPSAGGQLGLERAGERERRKLLGESLRQIRATIGVDSLLQVVEADPASRVPERRAFLTPIPDPDAAA